MTLPNILTLVDRALDIVETHPSLLTTPVAQSAALRTRSAIMRVLASAVTSMAQRFDVGDEPAVVNQYRVVATTYCVASVLYEEHATSIMSDRGFDRLCAHINTHWDEYTPMRDSDEDMRDIPRSQFEAGSGMGVGGILRRNASHRLTIADYILAAQTAPTDLFGVI